EAARTNAIFRLGFSVIVASVDGKRAQVRPRAEPTGGRAATASRGSGVALSPSHGWSFDKARLTEYREQRNRFRSTPGMISAESSGCALARHPNGAPSATNRHTRIVSCLTTMHLVPPGNPGSGFVPTASLACGAVGYWMAAAPN